MEALPVEVLVRVATSLDTRDLLTLTRVSRGIRESLQDAAYLWRLLVERQTQQGEELQGVWDTLSRVSAAAEAARSMPTAPLSETCTSLVSGALVHQTLATACTFKWLNVFLCLQRSVRPPWQLNMDWSGASSVHTCAGARLHLDLRLEQPVACESPRASLFQDGAAVVAFTVAGRSVEIIVGRNGRVHSPQQDWNQGEIRVSHDAWITLILEVTYLGNTPAWIVRSCAPGCSCVRPDVGFGSFIVNPRVYNMEAFHSMPGSPGARSLLDGLMVGVMEPRCTRPRFAWLLPRASSAGGQMAAPKLLLRNVRLVQMRSDAQGSYPLSAVSAAQQKFAAELKQHCGLDLEGQLRHCVAAQQAV